MFLLFPEVQQFVYTSRMMSTLSTPERMLRAVLLLIATAFLLACGTAPFIFNGLIAVGRAVPMLEGLRDLYFEEVISRLALIYLLLGFYPAVRLAGARSMAEFGLVGGVRWTREIVRGWLAGVLSVGLLFVIAWLSGAYVWAPDTWGRVAGRVVGYLVGGLLIGLIEETFFRGALFGLLRRIVAWLPAALAVSVFFSLVHFLRPEHPTGIVHGHWYSGFRLIPHLVRVTHDVEFYFPFALTLLLMGLVLCALYRRQGHLYFIIGLHAGWVLMLQGGRRFFDRDPDVLGWLFGTSDNMGRSWAATALLAGLFIATLCLPKGGRTCHRCPT